jgi:hypothetical protein
MNTAQSMNWVKTEDWRNHHHEQLPTSQELLWVKPSTKGGHKEQAREESQTHGRANQISQRRGQYEKPSQAKKDVTWHTFWDRRFGTKTRNPKCHYHERR